MRLTMSETLSSIVFRSITIDEFCVWRLLKLHFAKESVLVLRVVHLTVSIICSPGDGDLLFRINRCAELIRSFLLFVIALGPYKVILGGIQPRQ